MSKTLPLYEDPWFTFRFAEDRIIPRFHLEGVRAGLPVSVFKIDSSNGERLGLLTMTTVGEGGWVDLAEPLIVRAGEAFIAVPGPKTVGCGNGAEEERDMSLSPVEAIQRINESVTVEMAVQRTKCCSGSRQVFLDSEPNYRDSNNLGVVVTETAREKFSEAGIADPTAYFSGKTIRVRGIVIRKDKGPCIEVTDPSQIEIVT